MSAMTDSELKDLAQSRARSGPNPGELYRHYKGGDYVVVARSLMEDTLEPLVTYYAPAKGTYWTRTLKNFEEWVIVAEKSGLSSAGPRFRKVEGIS